MTAGGPDPAALLRAFERDAVAACLAMALVAWAVSGRADVGGGVIAGGVLMGLSYSAIKGGV
ncbi:MAG TPA: hypothetical protein VK911_16485, partial [Vicinamibacterales bacterium]|nr:hypothetical protein [Vicinamibacterales bacterium]